VKERPIIMTAESVQALEAGRKTQTSRLVRLPPDAAEVVVDPGGSDVFGPGPYLKVYRREPCDGPAMYPRIYSPFGYPGDRLWVKEAFWIGHDTDWDEASGRLVDCGVSLTEDKDAPLQYCASPNNPGLPDEPGDWFGPDDIFPERCWLKWSGGLGPSCWSKRSPLFMPRWASRFLLEIAMVRAMRIQQMTREDAIAEGVFFTDYGKHEHQLSVDGGKTWGVMLQQRAGWSYRKTTGHEQCLGSPQMAFANEWNRIHAGDRWNLKPGPSPWDQNPWVWVYTFRRTQ